MLGDLAAACATAAWNLANVELEKCGLTHAEAGLNKFVNFGHEAGILYDSNFDSVLIGRFANASHFHATSPPAQKRRGSNK